MKPNIRFYSYFISVVVLLTAFYSKATGGPVMVSSFQEERIDVSGKWISNTGLVYEILQEGNRFTWHVESINQHAEGTIEDITLRAAWEGGEGIQRVHGEVVEVIPHGRAVKIKWSDGVVFMREIRAEQVHERTEQPVEKHLLEEKPIERRGINAQARSPEVHFTARPTMIKKNEVLPEGTHGIRLNLPQEQRISAINAARIAAGINPKGLKKAPPVLITLSPTKPTSGGSSMSVYNSEGYRATHKPPYIGYVFFKYRHIQGKYTPTVCSFSFETVPGKKYLLDVTCTFDKKEPTYVYGEDRIWEFKGAVSGKYKPVNDHILVAFKANSSRSEITLLLRWTAYKWGPIGGYFYQCQLTRVD